MTVFHVRNEGFVQKNKKTIIIVSIILMTALLIIICCFMFFKKNKEGTELDSSPNDEKSQSPIPSQTGECPITEETDEISIDKNVKFGCEYIQSARISKQNLDGMIKSMNDFILLPYEGCSYIIRNRECCVYQIYYLKIKNNLERFLYWQELNRAIGRFNCNFKDERYQNESKEINKEGRAILAEMKQECGGNNISTKGFEERIKKLANDQCLLEEEILVDALKAGKVLDIPENTMSCIPLHPAYYLDFITRSLLKDLQSLQVISIYICPLHNENGIPSDFAKQISSLDTYLENVGSEDTVFVSISAIHAIRFKDEDKTPKEKKDEAITSLMNLCEKFGKKGKIYIACSDFAAEKKEKKE